MAITSQMVKEIRERTGTGMMDCKKALEAMNGDMEKAIEELQKKGLVKAAKKAGRIAAEGIIGHYIHGKGRLAVLVEVNCESDFVAKNQDFLTFVEDVAMHVCAMNPLYLKPEDVLEEDKAKQHEIFMAQARETKKPEKLLGNIVEGKMRKWLEENCLVSQKSVKDTEKTIEQIRAELVAKIGENISIRRFVRYEVGEGLEKRKHDLAAEVAEQLDQVK